MVGDVVDNQEERAVDARREPGTGHRHRRMAAVGRMAVAGRVTTVALALALEVAVAVPSVPVAMSATAGAATRPATTVAAGAEQSFTFSLLHQMVAASPSANQVASPYSLAEALLMLELGARGTTATQLGQTLDGNGNGDGEDRTPAQQAAAWASLAADLEQGARADKVALQDADSVWVEPGFEVSPPYLTSLRQDFDAGVRTADFAHHPAAAVAAVNQWAGARTHGKIPHLLSTSDIDSRTVMALLNAVYFKAPWQTPLSDEPSAPFHAPGGEVQVPYLGNDVSGDLLESHVGDGVEEVQLPYWNGVPATARSAGAGGAGRYAADIIMPTAQALPQWVDGLTATSWQHLMGQLTPQSVALRFPRFSLDANRDLNQSLQALGMTDAFSPQKADLSGISPEATYVKFVRQAATLDVTKWGTVATAATAIGVEATAARAQTLTVTIDRPFLFVIRDTTTGAILFTAAVDDPTGAG